MYTPEGKRPWVSCPSQHEAMDPSPVKAHLYSLLPRDDNVSVSHFPQNNSTSGLVQRCVCWGGGMNCRTNVIRQTLDVACSVQGECSHRLGLDGRVCLQHLPLSTHLESRSSRATLDNQEWPHRSDPPVCLSRYCHACLPGSLALGYTLCC